MKSEYLCKMCLTFESTEHHDKNVIRVWKTRNDLAREHFCMYLSLYPVLGQAGVLVLSTLLDQDLKKNRLPLIPS